MGNQHHRTSSCGGEELISARAKLIEALNTRAGSSALSAQAKPWRTAAKTSS